MTFTIQDLRKYLGPGLGLRKAKYLLEVAIPGFVPGLGGQNLNVLCQSAGLPERSISTTKVMHKGRTYVIKGETAFGSNSLDVSIIDDDKMNVRRMFDQWLTYIDNTKPKQSGLLGASFENDMLDNIKSGAALANTGVRMANDVAKGNFGGAVNLMFGIVDKGNAPAKAQYQTDVMIWQINNKGEKVYGYKLQNAFPSQLGIVQLDDGDETALSQFSVLFSYSEMIPVDGSFSQQFAQTVFGDSITQTAEIGLSATSGILSNITPSAVKADKAKKEVPHKNVKPNGADPSQGKQIKTEAKKPGPSLQDLMLLARGVPPEPESRAKPSKGKQIRSS
jgi:hypothetical protein